MADIIAASVAEPSPKAKPALSATSDMPEVKAEPPALSEERIPEEKDKPVDGEGDKPEAETVEEPTTEDGDELETKGKDETPAWMKAKITRETNKRRDAETARAAAENNAKTLQANLTKALTALEQMGGQNADKVAKDLETSDPRPKREGFETPEAYDTALIDWSTRRATIVATAELKAQQKKETDEKTAADTKAANEARNAETAKAYEGRKAKFMEEHPDFEELVETDDLKISLPMADAILNDDDGPAIAYYLGKNPDEAERISKLGAVKAIAEMGRIAARLTAKPIVSTKPNPITPLKSGAGSATRKTANEESMEEYAKRRNPEIIAQRRPYVGGGAPN